MDILTAIIIAIIGSGFLNIILNRIFTRLDTKRYKDDKTDIGLRLIMKDRLRYLCKKYIEQDWIYADELEDLLTMHDAYHSDLSGNGYLDVLIEKVKKIEVRIPENRR